MIVKGIIKSIDVQGNTCVVRMPSFETAGNDEIVATATVSNSPGSYNGYKVDDVVWVAFENDQLECPVIIGKLYLGIEAERADPRGTLNVVDSKISRTAEIPFDTKLGRNLEPGMPKTLAPFNSLNSIASNLSAAEVNIAQNDRDYGNRFRQTFEAIDGNKTLIDQTNEYIKNEVQSYDGDAFGWRLDTGEKDSESNYIRKPSWRVYAKGNSAYLAGAEIWLTYRDDKYFYVLKYIGESDTSIEANITISSGNYFLDGIDTGIEYLENEANLHKINVDKNKVLTVKLDDTENKYYWYINNIKTNLEVHETIDILTANEDGLNVTGTVTATEGKIGNFNIEPREGGWGGLYTDGYATEFKEASKLSENSETGVYIGPDGLMIGKNFSIDAYGNIKSSQLDIMSKRVNAITSSSFDDGISIPLTFQRVEGLKSKEINEKKSGYINTGHTLNDAETLEIKFLINDEDTVDATSIEDNFVFGCLNNAAGLALKVGKFEEGNNIAVITGTTSQFYSISTGTKHRIRITNNQPIEIDGKATGEAITYTSVAVTEEVVAPLSVESRIVPDIRPVYVFERNDDWSGGGSIVGETYESGNILLFGAKDNNTIKTSESITIYSFKIYNSDNNLIDYFIPATRNDDVKTGMYNVKSGSEEDIKNGTFSECQLDSGNYGELIVLQNTIIYESNFSVMNDKITSEISETTKYIDDKYEKNKSLIEQTAQDITAKVSTKLSSLNSGGEEKELENGITTKGLGWSLDNEKWAVKAYDQNAEGTLPDDGLDLFTISRDTIEINAPNVRLSGYPSSTIISYTSTNNPTEITDDNKDEYTWSEDMPEWENGKYIWQRTTIKKWEYQKVEKDSVDENGESTKIYVEEWVDAILSDKIVCLAGASAASYWLNCASNFHFGIRHIDTLHVSAWRKVGTGVEELDSDAILYWWNPSSSESNKWVKAININFLDFTANNFRQLIKDNDLKIVSTHDSTFTPNESTTSGTVGVCSFITIKYSPLSSPILELSPESSTIQYSSDGTTKLGTSVSSTAKLYLNGEILSYDPRDTAKTSPRVSYTWNVSDCEYMLSEKYVPNDTITIKSLSADTITATCTATVQAAYNDVEGLFEGATYQKVFTVSKVFQGISVVSQTTYYALVNPVFGKDQPNLAKPTSDLIIRAEGYPNDPLYQAGNTSSSLTEKWSVYPPAHTSTTIEAGWKYWTSIKTTFSGNEEDSEFSTPIISEDISGAYALAQSKTTNYYSETDPNNGTNIIKKGDCWFKTISQTNEEEYNKDQDGQEQGKLYQWNGTEWENIGGELVANKLTANYINALDITSKKVTVIDNNQSKVLFDANGLTSTPYVKIAGFNVESNTLTTGSLADGNLIKINSDSNSPYNFYNLTPEEINDTYINNYNSLGTISVKPFLKAGSLWLYENKHYLDFSADNSMYSPNTFVITKVIFTQKITQDFKIYFRDTSSGSNDYVIISTLNASKVPTATPTSDSYAKASSIGNITVLSTTFTASNTSPITAGSYFYIVYRHTSTNTSSSSKGQVFLPVDIRLSIGDNFQVLADGSVYAKNLFLGRTTSESTNTGENDLSNESNAGGELAAAQARIGAIEADYINTETLNATNARIGAIEADYVNTTKLNATNARIRAIENDYITTDELDAVSAKIDSLETNQIIVTDSSETNIIFKADGGSDVEDAERVQIGGFKVNSDSIYSDSYISNYDSIPNSKDHAEGVLVSQHGIKVGSNFSINGSGNMKVNTCQINSGKIGGWNLSSSGLFSDTIRLKTNEIEIGSGSIYASKSSESSIYDKLIINGGSSKSGFRLGYSTSSSSSVKITFKTYYSSGWKLDVNVAAGLLEKTDVTIYLMGRVGIWASLRVESKTFVFEPSITSQSFSYDLYDEYGFLGSRGVDLALVLSSLTESNCNKNKTSRTKTKTIYQYTSSNGVNESLGNLNPFFNNLSLGTQEDPWDTIWVRKINIATNGLSYSSELGNGSNGSSTNYGSGSSGGGSLGKPIFGGCFDEGTKITLADGTLKNIEEITTNDYVLSYNVYEKRFEKAKVTSTQKYGMNKDLVVLDFSDGTEIWTTMTHPFYTTEGWTSLYPNYDYSWYEDIAEDFFVMMHIGQEFHKVEVSSSNSIDSEIKLVTLENIRYRHGVNKEHCVYNLDVEGCNTFFADGILGHNAMVKVNNSVW